MAQEWNRIDEDEEGEKWKMNLHRLPSHQTRSFLRLSGEGFEHLRCPMHLPMERKEDMMAVEWERPEDAAGNEEEMEG